MDPPQVRSSEFRIGHRHHRRLGIPARTPRHIQCVESFSFLLTTRRRWRLGSCSHRKLFLILLPSGSVGLGQDTVILYDFTVCRRVFVSALVLAVSISYLCRGQVYTYCVCIPLKFNFALIKSIKKSSSPYL